MAIAIPPMEFLDLSDLPDHVILPVHVLISMTWLTAYLHIPDESLSPRPAPSTKAKGAIHGFRIGNEITHCPKSPIIPVILLSPIPVPESAEESLAVSTAKCGDTRPFCFSTMSLGYSGSKSYDLIDVHPGV
jgi:hypothetical protein